MFIVGLGNPGEEYQNTRHNVGRLVATFLHDLLQGDGFENNKPLKAHTAKVTIAGKQTLIITPDTFMNLSGKSVAPLIQSKKDLEKLIVIYDDLDLAKGTFKISFNRSAGGHNGVASIIKSVKSEGFIRIRVGISPTTATGKLKKPLGEEKVSKLIMGSMKSEELAELKKFSKTILQSIEMIVSEGLPKAMSIYNGR